MQELGAAKGILPSASGKQPPSPHPPKTLAQHFDHLDSVAAQQAATAHPEAAPEQSQQPSGQPEAASPSAAAAPATSASAATPATSGEAAVRALLYAPPRFGAAGASAPTSSVVGGGDVVAVAHSAPAAAVQASEVDPLQAASPFAAAGPGAAAVGSPPLSKSTPLAPNRAPSGEPGR